MTACRAQKRRILLRMRRLDGTGLQSQFVDVVNVVCCELEVTERAKLDGFFRHFAKMFLTDAGFGQTHRQANAAVEVFELLNRHCNGSIFAAAGEVNVHNAACELRKTGLVFRGAVFHPGRENNGEAGAVRNVVHAGKLVLNVMALSLIHICESVPLAAAEGDGVLSGAINQNATLEIRVTKRFQESTVSKILELTQNASSRKANTEKFITKFARVYTPIVVGAAVLVAVLPPLFLGWNTFGDWLYRALIFLVISCPCALVVSIPLGFFGGIGGASKRGILVKGSNYLEALHSVDTVVLDKTGTLTRGRFSVQALSPAAGVSEADLLEAAAFAESRSSHPIAKSILERYGRPVKDSRIAESRENAGFGTEVTLTDGTVLLAGSAKLMQRHGIAMEQPSLSAGTLVYVAKNGMFLGSLLIADTLKPTSAEAVRALKAAGVKEVVMLTGDSPSAAAAIAKEAGITSWRAELLPQDKVAAVDSMLEGRDPKHKLAFVGDGINDAPVIARADVGVAMGGIGSDAAIEAADVVLMTDDLAKLPLAIRIARKTKRIVTQNIVFALGVKIIVLALSVVGITSMWIAIFADVGVALLAILNALRAMRVKEVSEMPMTKER